MKNAEDHDHPMCVSCNYGKQSRRPTKSIGKVPVSSKVDSLKKEKLEKGDLVATDQFVVWQGGDCSPLLEEKEKQTTSRVEPFLWTFQQGSSL